MLLTWDTRKGDPQSNGLRRFSLIWQWYVMPTSDTTGCFQEHMSICSIVMSVHMIHQYLSECRAVKYPRLVIKQRHEHVFLCIYRLSSTVDDCSSNVVSALYDSKYTWVPLAHARPFITCRVNNTVLCILLSRSNDEWTCIYARGIGTISGHRSNPWQKQVVKSSEPNADTGKESKLPLSQNHLSCLCKGKVKRDSDAIPSTLLTLFRC